MFEGEIVGEFPPSVTEEELGVAMTGGGRKASVTTGPDPALLAAPTSDGRAAGRRRGQSFATRYALAQKAGGIVVRSSPSSSFLIGGVVVLITTGSNPISTYRAIFEGAGLNWFTEVGSYEIRVPFTDAHVWFPWNVDDIESTAAFNLQQTLINFVPLVLTGLAVGFAFRCGMFNIGGQGQYLGGAIMAVWVGSELPGLPGFVHVLAAVIAGMLVGAVWAGIAGFLKATVGTHEVISTIMLNWIAIWIGVFSSGSAARSRTTRSLRPGLERRRRGVEAADLLGRPVPAGAPRGFFVALAALVVYWITLNRTTLGYEVRRSASTPRPPATAASRSRATTSSRWRSRARSPGSPARSTPSAGPTGSTRTTCRSPPRSPSSGSRWRCSGATRRSGSAFRRSCSPRS